MPWVVEAIHNLIARSTSTIASRTSRYRPSGDSGIFRRAVYADRPRQPEGEAPLAIPRSSTLTTLQIPVRSGLRSLWMVMVAERQVAPFPIESHPTTMKRKGPEASGLFRSGSLLYPVAAPFLAGVIVKKEKPVQTLDGPDLRLYSPGAEPHQPAGHGQRWRP